MYRYYITKDRKSIIQAEIAGPAITVPGDAIELTQQQAVEAYEQMGFQAAVNPSGVIELAPIMGEEA